MRFDVLTLFPEMFSGYLTQSILKLGSTAVWCHSLLISAIGDKQA